MTSRYIAHETDDEEFDGLEVGKLCEGREGEIAWIDALSESTHYYNLARQYIASKLNYYAINWSETDSDDATTYGRLIELAEAVLHSEEIDSCTDGDRPNNEALSDQIRSLLDGEFEDLAGEFDLEEDADSLRDQLQDKLDNFSQNDVCIDDQNE